MTNEKIPTAEEVLDKDIELFEDIIDGKLSFGMAREAIANKMIEFATLHVQAALKAAAENAKIEYDHAGDPMEVDKNSIVDAYPLNQIV